MRDKPLITDIQRFAVNDGPGIRTSVFLKGCPLNCRWCHNPETMDALPAVYWKRRLCVQCGECMDACPNTAVNPPVSPDLARLPDSGYQKIIRSRCDLCLKCVSACRYDALTVIGQGMTVDEILEEVEKDRPFYDNSGGGITVSGGEPTTYPEFSGRLLQAAKENGIHTCLDTNGFCSREVMQQVAEHADIVLFDLKHIDGDIHRKYTGAGNAAILENLARLSQTGKEIWVRIPVIPGCNDTMDFHGRAAQFLADLPGPIRRIDLLAYHNWCQDKYDWLGIEWEMAAIESTEPSFLEIPADIYREKGFMTTVGGSGFEAWDTGIRIPS